jgi:hypothetical protein
LGQDIDGGATANETLAVATRSATAATLRLTWTAPPYQLAGQLAGTYSSTDASFAGPMTSTNGAGGSWQADVQCSVEQGLLTQCSYNFSLQSDRFWGTFAAHPR